MRSLSEQAVRAPHVGAHERAAAVHDEAAVLHERASAFWHVRGAYEREAAERLLAAENRARAERSREIALLDRQLSIS
jgi:hypothetical protein